MVFRLTDQETIREIQREFPGKSMMSQPTLSRMKKEIKGRCVDFYNTIKKNQDSFLYLVLEKYRNVDILIREYYRIYNNENTSEPIKLKILDKIMELEAYQLRLTLDMPYLELYHKDARDEFERLDTEIKELKEQSGEEQKPTLSINPIFKTANPNRIPIDSITKNKEIQEILMSRTESGFERISIRKPETNM
jgi:hypothetical protein